MAGFGEKARVALVCLTALMTLVAGSPHVQCRCPDGRLKPFCLVSFSRAADSAGCCCGTEGPSSRGRCCLAPGTTPARKASSCCGHSHGRRQRATADGTDRVQGVCCTRTMVPSGDLALAPSAPEPSTDPTSVVLFSSPAASAAVLPSEGRLLSWQAHLLAPPPTDLITLLQRLTI